MRESDKELNGLSSVLSDQPGSVGDPVQPGSWLYRELLEAIPSPVVVYDSQGKTVFVNQAFVDTYGYSRQALMSGSVSFVPESEKEATSQAWLRTLAGEKVFLETERYTKDGRVLKIQMRTALVLDDHGNHRYTIVIHNDVTEAKRSEQEKLETERLQAAMETAGAVCHEMSQPLQAVLTVIELMRAAGSSSQEWPRLLDRLYQQIERLTHTTKQLNDLTDFKTKPYLNNMKILDLDQASSRADKDQ